MVADEALLLERLFGDRLKPEVRDENQTPTTDVAGAACCPAVRGNKGLSDTSTTCTERGVDSPTTSESGATDSEHGVASATQSTGKKEKGETITCPLATSAGTISCIAVFAFSCHTVLQKIAFAQKGCLRIFAPSIKKK